ncbi:Hypp4345 [Branchiostoma lanceolatum]|uniref:Hypp4345 protein n=1 Tax=Branchiostoma lanceolatum TaxID=7740 RepID=A0A8K0A714_BRALA|nr:Hypp4345 [Branchiostoma lanceolatum]
MAISCMFYKMVRITFTFVAITFCFGQALEQHQAATAMTPPSSPPEVVALHTNFTAPVGGMAMFPFSYQLPEGTTEADVHTTVYFVKSLQMGRKNIGAIDENGITRYDEGYEGRVTFQVSVEEGKLDLTVNLSAIQHPDQGWYEVVFRVYGRRPVLDRTYLSVVDALVCPALVCPGNRSICTVADYSTGAQPYIPPNCTCECEDSTEIKPGSDVTAPGISVGMALFGIVIVIVLVVSLERGWVAIRCRPPCARVEETGEKEQPQPC